MSVLKKYIISCELNSLEPGESGYPELIELLEGNMGAVRIQNTLWGLKSTLNAEMLHDKISAALRKKDKLLVTEIGTNCKACYDGLDF